MILPSLNFLFIIRYWIYVDFISYPCWLYSMYWSFTFSSEFLLLNIKRCSALLISVNLSRAMNKQWGVTPQDLCTLCMSVCSPEAVVQFVLCHPCCFWRMHPSNDFIGAFIKLTSLWPLLSSLTSLSYPCFVCSRAEQIPPCLTNETSLPSPWGTPALSRKRYRPFKEKLISLPVFFSCCCVS